MPHAVGMRMFVNVRRRRIGVARLDTRKLPQRERAGPREQEQRDDDVAELREVDAGDVREERARKSSQPIATCSRSMLPIASATATDSAVVVML